MYRYPNLLGVENKGEDKLQGTPDALSGARYMLRAAVVTEIRSRMGHSGDGA